MTDKVEFSTKIDNLPDLSGCYLFKGSDTKIIYIGKAKSLKKRVRSYFTKTAQDPKTEKLISQIADFEVIVTQTEMEAMILESNLIKEHRPKYNIDFKDDKRFPYIKVTTNELYPRIFVVRRAINDNCRYFGPFSNVTGMRRTLRLIGKLFPVRSCSLVLPSKRKYRVCLDYFIGKCPGCCEAGKTTPEEYNSMIAEVLLFLSGKSRQVMDNLRQKMELLSEELKFEEAARVRDQIQGIESVIRRQRVVSADIIDRDVIALSSESTDAVVALLQIREGALLGEEHFAVETVGEDTEAVIQNFIIRYYKTASFYPSEIIVPAELPNREMIEEYLREISGSKITIIAPRRGSKSELLEMALSNARHNLDLLLAQKSASKRRIPHVIYSLSRDLYLKKLPRTIAACDISNLGKELAVGSVVFFSDGKPHKSGYRRMRIKTIEGQDDFAMMKELVTRYFNHLAENQVDYPELLLIDGGKGQLSSALDALRELNIIDQQVASIAKKFEEVYLPKRSEPISIPRASSSLRLLQRIRDEAHRFAVEYHRLLKSKKLEISELQKIKGIGKKRQLSLIAAFGSLEQVSRASIDDLLAVPGMNRKAAEAIQAYFERKSVDG